MNEEQLQQILDIISDRNSCLTELARARTQLVHWITNKNFNGGRKDVNGCWEVLPHIQEQVDKLDALIEKLSKEDTNKE